MTVRTHVPDGAPIWIDLSTSDQAASRTFYGGLFGWSSQEPDPELGGYLNFSLRGGLVAGCVPAMPGAPANVWSVYLATSDAEQSVKAALAGGGAVHAPAMDVHELGRMAIVADPTGAGVGLWQPGTHQGLLTLAEPGHAAWFELRTRDTERTLAFTRDVFGWQTNTVADTPDFRYETASVDGTEAAGILHVGPDTDPGWTVYFQVSDADASMARVVELGGDVVAAPVDTPYGRLGTFRDQTGASFNLVS